MTLRRQLLWGITLFLVAVSFGILVLSVSLSRSYLEQQMASHAQDAATALSHEVSLSLESGDLTLAETLLATVFDRGYFQEIAILAPLGEPLIVKRQPIVIEGVPLWFSRRFQLETPPGEALLSSGWRQLGRIVVVSQPTLAYQHLWASGLLLGGLMLGVLIVSLLLMGGFLHLILAPLRRIEQAAHAFCDKQFVQISPLPRTRELLSVVTAMNDASHRISFMLDSAEKRAERFRKEAYEDGLTRLSNRRNFDLRLAQLLSDEATRGRLLVIEMDGLKTFNLERGHREGDALLLRVAETAVEELGPACTVAARIGGNAFAFLCPEQSDQEIETRAGAILRRLLQDEVSAPPDAGVSILIGIAPLRHGETVGRVMSNADLALERARQSGVNRIASVLSQEEASGPMGSQDWRRTLDSALAEDRFALLSQAVVALSDGALIHREIFARLVDEQGRQLHAASFIPMAQRHRHIVQIDMAVIRLLLAAFARFGPDAGPICINVSPQSVEDDAFLAWLTPTLRELGERARLLCLEVPEVAAINHADRVRLLGAALHDVGAQLGIDRFGLHPAALSVLRQTQPDYIKLDGELVRDLAESAGSRLVVTSILHLAHSLDIRVIALHVERDEMAALLREEGVDGGQGFLFGKPEPLGVHPIVS